MIQAIDMPTTTNTINVDHLGRVVVITLNRPRVLNALNAAMMTELVDMLEALDGRDDVGCFVLTGSERAFAAGADIKELASKSVIDMMREDFLSGWQRIAALRTPKIAAVAGYALGGGCELAMMCDFIYAADSAVFGQPEIKLGVVPGMGGSQRLTKLIGKAKAMEMILTGRTISAEEAERAGLVACVFAADELMHETLISAEMIASYSKPAAVAARELVDRALETGLADGLLLERRVYHSLWATADQQEGMAAFLEKRVAHFTHR